MRNRIGLILAGVALTGALAALLTQPVNRFSWRCGLLLDLAALYVVALGLVWPWRPLRVSWSAMPLLLLAFLGWPSGPWDSQALSSAYVSRMVAYQGTPYLWGGESRQAIDCSGLVERGLIDAMVATGQPALIRRAFDLWWHRAAADALRDGYRGFTRRVCHVPVLGALDDTTLRPGDLMVPDNGEHVMAWIGHGTWIEADPTVGKVISLPVSTSYFYFKRPAWILRWAVLE